MSNKNPKNKDTVQLTFFTQQELAQRWRVSESTIMKWREDGQIPFFRPPGSIRPLYPIVDIMAIEVDRNHRNEKEIIRRVSNSTRREKPVAPNTKWEV